MADAIVDRGLVHDVTILERVSEEEGPKVRAFNAALFETGGPVLVTPPRAPAVVGDRVAVVWSGTIQSARAVRSAMPAIVAAAEVLVLTNSANTRADADDLMGYLDAHGVSPESHVFDSSDMSARARGRAVLGVVRVLEADLLVIGAYGKNRLDEILGLGGATQKVATACPVPVLLQS